LKENKYIIKKINRDKKWGQLVIHQNITIQTGVNILGSESYGKQMRKEKKNTETVVIIIRRKTKQKKMKHNPDLTLTSCCCNETKKIDSLR
jgi:hypothetical protein